MCDECSTCTSVLANQARGHEFVQSDVTNVETKATSTMEDPSKSYIACDETYSRPTLQKDPDTGLMVGVDAGYMEDSQTAQALQEDPGGYCSHHMPCYEWTGLRPYSHPQLAVGGNMQTRAIPSGRYEHSSALVLNRATGERDLLVVFGGFSVDCTDYCEDWWHYHIPQNVWTKIADAERPSPARRWKAAMTDYKDLAFMFGGHGARLMPRDVDGGQPKRPNEVYDTETTYNPENPLIFDDLWVYNATEREWSRLFPRCVTCADEANRFEPDGTEDRDRNGPRGRFGASLVYFGDALYLFGGYAHGGPSKYESLYPTGAVDQYPSLESKYYLNDVWKYNITYNEWSELRPHPDYPTRPSARYGHAAAMSTKILHGLRQPVMLVFGGYTWDDEMGDLWQYNISSNTWAKTEGEGTFPSRRYRHSMVAVGQNDKNTDGRMLVFGGHGCLSGESYVQATKDKVVGVEENPEYNNRYIQRPNLVGEKYCIEELADLWQYYPTSCPRDCSRHGLCEYNFCVCDQGFTGNDCSNVSCPADDCYFDYFGRQQVCFQCNGRGECNGYTGQCMCRFPASGLSCEFTECLNQCNGHGTCDRTRANSLGYGVCLCDLKDGLPAYEGLDCSIPICPAQNVTVGEGTCNGRGNCVNGTCICYPGFGDSFLYRLVTDEEDDEDAGIRVPVDVSGNDLRIDEEKCPPGSIDETEAETERARLALYSNCYREADYVPVGDCGDIIVKFAAAFRAEAMTLLVLALSVWFCVIEIFGLHA